MDAFVGTVSNAEESPVFDGGVEGSDSGLHADDDRGEAVKHPGCLDMKESELVVDIVGLAGACNFGLEGDGRVHLKGAEDV